MWSLSGKRSHDYFGSAAQQPSATAINHIKQNKIMSFSPKWAAPAEGRCSVTQAELKRPLRFQSRLNMRRGSQVVDGSRPGLVSAAEHHHTLLSRQPLCSDHHVLLCFFFFFFNIPSVSWCVGFQLWASKRLADHRMLNEMLWKLTLMLWTPHPDIKATGKKDKNKTRSLYFQIRSVCIWLKMNE